LKRKEVEKRGQVTGRQEIEPIITAPISSPITVRRVSSSPGFKFSHHRAVFFLLSLLYSLFIIGFGFFITGLFFFYFLPSTFYRAVHEPPHPLANRPLPLACSTLFFIHSPQGLPPVTGYLTPWFPLRLFFSC